MLLLLIVLAIFVGLLAWWSYRSEHRILEIEPLPADRPAPQYVPKLGDMDDAVIHEMRRSGQSPCCKARLLTGPRGGASVNVFCEKCGAGYNIADENIPLGVDMGECIKLPDHPGDSAR